MGESNEKKNVYKTLHTRKLSNTENYFLLE